MAPKMQVIRTQKANCCLTALPVVVSISQATGGQFCGRGSENPNLHQVALWFFLGSVASFSAGANVRGCQCLSLHLSLQKVHFVLFCFVF